GEGIEGWGSAPPARVQHAGAEHPHPNPPPPGGGDLAARVAMSILALSLLFAQPAIPPEEPAPAADEAPAPVDNESIEGRRRPGYTGPLPDAVTQDNPGAVRAPPPEAFPTDDIPIPDRWRLIESLGLVKERWFDPYNQNTLKGDRPLKPEDWPFIKGDDWFFAANLVS